MYFPDVTYKFVMENIDLNWRDVLWGVEKGIINCDFAQKVADVNLTRGSMNELETELVLLDKVQVWAIKEKIRQLSSAEVTEEVVCSKKKWMYVALKWLFENRRKIEDALGLVELVYADFDYPAEIESFVRYMPSQCDYDPRAHSVEKNMERLYLNWGAFLSGGLGGVAKKS
ncbi:DUF2247 family protein [Pseudomonas sp. MPB26]|uniref:DUF2247 family protein n=1 Tax=Pseudomonas sp. MPB26 TaxID=3388491 RepID=UPI0039851653